MENALCKSFDSSRLGFRKIQRDFFVQADEALLSFCYPFLATVQEVDLVKPLPVAHLHDFTLEIFHSGIGAAVLAARPCVGWSVHVGQKRDFINSQGVDDDMHMDIAAVVMPVRVGAD